MDADHFSWRRVRDLLGLPYDDPRVHGLFTDAGLEPGVLWRELRVGVYAMEPYDRQPPPIAEIDLIPSYGVRFRFRHARLVLGAQHAGLTEFVLSGVTYFADSPEPAQRFRGQLPHGLSAADGPDEAVARVGRTPTAREWKEGGETGFLSWEDRNPVLHLLFSIPEQRILRVNVFLAASPEATTNP